MPIWFNYSTEVCAYLNPNVSTFFFFLITMSFVDNSFLCPSEVPQLRFGDFEAPCWTPFEITLEQKPCSTPRATTLSFIDLGKYPEVTAAFGWLSKSQGEWRKKKKRKVSKGLRVAACYCLTLCSTEQKHKSVSFQSFTRVYGGSVDHGSYGDASDETLCCHSLEREWTNR